MVLRSWRPWRLEPHHHLVLLEQLQGLGHELQLHGHVHVQGDERAAPEQAERVGKGVAGALHRQVEKAHLGHVGGQFPAQLLGAVGGAVAADDYLVADAQAVQKGDQAVGVAHQDGLLVVDRYEDAVDGH